MYICFDENDEGWQKLVQSFGGDEKKAFAAWEANNYNYSDDIYSNIAQDAVLEEDVAEEPKDKYYKEKQIVLDKAESILKHKLKSLKYAVNKHEHLDTLVTQMNGVLQDLENYETDFAIIKFIQGSERMINSSLKWLEKIENDPSKLNANTLKRIYESVSQFEILNTLSEDFFEDPEHKEEYRKVSDLLSKINNIHNRYITEARDFLVDHITPGFQKVKAFYEEKAEREYNESKLKVDKARGLNKEDLRKAKQEYIYRYLAANKTTIDKETKEYVENMVVQIADISSLIRFIENPRDINHDIIGVATEALDLSNRDVRQKTINKTYEGDKLNKAFIDYIGKQSDPKKQYAELFATDEKGNILPILVNEDSFNWKSFTEKYKDTPVMELHTFLYNLSKEKTKLTGTYKSLGFKLPSINKSNLERFYSNGSLDTLKQGFLDHFRITAQDTDYGQVEIDEANDKKLDIKSTIKVKANAQGLERSEIPLYYRYKIDEKDLSYDIVSSFLMDYNNSLQFNARTETGLFLEMLKDVVNEASVEQRVTLTKKLKIDSLTGKTVTTTAETSNVAKALESLIRHRIYGISVEGDPKTAKILNQIKNATSFITLGGNVLSGAANYLQGESVMLIEAIGNKDSKFSIKDRAKASLKFDKDIGNIMKDIGEITPTSKTNRLITYFDALSDFEVNENKFIKNNKFKKVMDSGAMMFANQFAEYTVQTVLMYSRLNNIKALNSSGKYLTKEFTETANRDEAISIDEAIVGWSEENNPIFHKSVSKTDITSDLSEKSMFKIESDIKRINRDLYGNYDSLNKSELERNAFGALLTQMRKWIVTGIQKRYRGIGNVKTKTEDLDIKQRSFNTQTDQFEEGTYTTSIKFLYNLVKEWKALRMKTVPENWNKLTNNEKANIKMTMVEIGMAISLWALATALRSGDDDDEDKLLLAYLSRRLYSELISFANINEALRTFRSPMMVTNTMESIVDVITQASTAPTEEYETGFNKGENKLKHKLVKLIPVWKQYDRNLEQSMLFLEK